MGGTMTKVPMHCKQCGRPMGLVAVSEDCYWGGCASKTALCKKCTAECGENVSKDYFLKRFNMGFNLQKYVNDPDFWDLFWYSSGYID